MRPAARLWRLRRVSSRVGVMMVATPKPTMSRLTPALWGSRTGPPGVTTGRTAMASTEPLVGPPATTPIQVLRVALAVAIVGGPAAFVVGGILSPSIHADGATTIAANASATPALNAAHLAAFVT